MAGYTGYKRSLTFTVTKTVDSEISDGYPKVYPTATDIANGYFIYFGTQVALPTDEQLANMSQNAYNALVSQFKGYIEMSEPGFYFALDSTNENQVFDDTSCPVYLITTTTTELPN